MPNGIEYLVPNSLAGVPNKPYLSTLDSFPQSKYHLKVGSPWLLYAINAYNIYGSTPTLLVLDITLMIVLNFHLLSVDIRLLILPLLLFR